MKIRVFPWWRQRRGYALLMVLMMLMVACIVLSATMRRTTTNSKLNDRNNTLVAAQSAAEAATEKALAQLMMDYQLGAEGRIMNNIGIYRTNIPNASENPYWADFQFTDAQGGTDRSYVQRTSIASNAVYTALSESYQGLSGFCSNYRIVSNVRPANGVYNNLVGAVRQDVQVAEIPIFQFAIFYNSRLEFTWAAPLNVRGRTHANSNIFVGSASDLTFSQTVTCTGIITNPPWDGKTQGQYTGAINYNGQPPPGWVTGYNTLTLPIGTTNTPDAVREIINLPVTNEDVNSPVGQQRYYNKAGMVIQVGDNNFSNTAIVVTLKNSPSDGAPVSFTNNTLLWTNTGIATWLSTGNRLGDQREGQIMRLTEINVGNLSTWMNTNAVVAAKFSAANPLNILYVADLRSTNSITNSAVRLVNGLTLPTNGLTVATINPLYIRDNYNCPNPAFLGSTNTSASAPASLVADALTVLSGNWNDAASMSLSYPARNWIPPNTTVNAAVISGMVYSTGSSDTQFSGGVVNQPRLQENWNGRVLTLNTSIVNLYNSVRAAHQWQSPGIYYRAPSRNFNFDTAFTIPNRLPPGTPRVRKLIRSAYWNPPPGDVTSLPQTNDFIPF